jgi:hypothetical protein
LEFITEIDTFIASIPDQLHGESCDKNAGIASLIGENTTWVTGHDTRRMGDST